VESEQNWSACASACYGGHDVRCQILGVRIADALDRESRCVMAAVARDPPLRASWRLQGWTPKAHWNECSIASRGAPAAPQDGGSRAEHD
jgi:hypothetical protein